MPDDDFAGLEDFIPDLIPDGAVPVLGLLVIEYLTSDGTTEHVYQELGDSSATQILGLLEVGKHLVFEDMEDT